MPERTYRVIQWVTGHVGSVALQHFIENLTYELVGLRVTSPDKVGRDAGDVAGTAPTGVIATDDVDVVLAAQPDCVVYMPHWPDISELERLLTAGVDVVTTARLVTGEYYPDDAGPRLAAAALAGGSTLVGTGMNPMHVPTVALAATAMCRHVSRIRVTESMDCFGYGNTATWTGYGFGVVTR